jgi:biotin carboxylase
MSNKEDRRKQLAGKRILIIGIGSKSKVWFVERVVELGCYVIVVDMPDSPGIGTLGLETFLPIDTSVDTVACDAIIVELDKLGYLQDNKIDGVWCFWEDNLTLTSLVAERLNLPYNSAQSTRVCRSKKLTRDAMEKAGLPTPTSILCKTLDDLEQALLVVPFPAVVKPVFGASAQGASKVLNADEARIAFQHNMDTLNPDFDPIYAQGTDCILEQYIDGDEVDVDALIQDGELKFFSLTDNLPTLEPSFVNTGSNLPSVLPLHKQTELVNLAFLAATKACGITMGACHIEMKYTTSSGPQLIEVNGRMGGMPFPTWLKAVWDIDFIEESICIALSIPINPVKPSPLTYLAGTYILSNCDGIVSQQDVNQFETLKKDSRIFQVYMDFQAGSQVFTTGTREQRGYITACGDSMQSAVSIYNELCNPRIFPMPEYLWIAGAELLPSQSLNETERHRRQSISIITLQRKASMMDERTARRRASSLVSMDEELVGRYLLPNSVTLSASPMSSQTFPDHI